MCGAVLSVKNGCGKQSLGGSLLMVKMLKKLWNDDGGALIATEFLFVATILIIGIVVGLSAVRVAVNAELTELANAILALSQSYTVSGQAGCCASTEGS